MVVLIERSVWKRHEKAGGQAFCAIESSAPGALCLKALCECDEILDGEPLGAKVEDRIGSVHPLPQQRFKRVPESLTPLVEGSLHHCFEEFLVAAQLGP